MHPVDTANSEADSGRSLEMERHMPEEVLLVVGTSSQESLLAVAGNLVPVFC